MRVLQYVCVDLRGSYFVFGSVGGVAQDEEIGVMVAGADGDIVESDGGIGSDDALPSLVEPSTVKTDSSEEDRAAAVGAEGDIVVSGERPEDIAMHGPGSDGIPRYKRLP